MQARTWTSSSSSIRATGMPSCTVSITESTAPSIVSNAQVADAITSGMPKSLSATSVITPSVPSLPTKSRVRS